MRCIALLLLLGAAPQDNSFDRQVDALAQKLVVAEDGDLSVFKVAISTPPGRIVLRDRAAKAAEKLKGTAERDAIPSYFDTYFERIDGVYRLRPGQEAWKRRQVSGYTASRKELARIVPFVKEVAENMAEEPPVNAILKKMLSQEDAAEIFYLRDIRPKTRPDVYTLERALGEFMTRDSEGKLHVPESRREKAENALSMIGPIVEMSERRSKEFHKFCSELADFDDLHKRLKKLSADPLLLGTILRKALQGLDQENPEAGPARFKEAADQLFQKLPEIVLTTPEGKVLTEEAYEGVEEALERYAKARQIVDVMQEASRDFAAQMKTGDELHDGFRKAIQSPIILALLGQELLDGQVDPLEVVKAQIGRAVAKGDDGKYRVLPEFEEEVANEIKDPEKASRKERRALRLVSMYGRKIEDEELKKIFTSWFGRFEVERSAKLELEVAEYDGIGAWIRNHFNRTETGYVLKDGSREEIKAIIAQVKQLEKEAEANDLEK